MNHSDKIFIIFDFPFKIFVFIIIKKLNIWLKYHLYSKLKVIINMLKFFQILFLKIQNKKKDK